jgi:hypothetical protein
MTDYCFLYHLGCDLVVGMTSPPPPSQIERTFPLLSLNLHRRRDFHCIIAAAMFASSRVPPSTAPVRHFVRQTVQLVINPSAHFETSFRIREMQLQKCIIHPRSQQRRACDFRPRKSLHHPARQRPFVSN